MAGVAGPLAVRHILRLLHRKDELGQAALVCRDWHALTRRVRALWPSSARELAIRVRLADSDGHLPASADGEHFIWRHGLWPPMLLYCHNVLSQKPTEFLTLRAVNESSIPRGGSIRGATKHVRTRFKKIRIDPRSLLVKVRMPGVLRRWGQCLWLWVKHVGNAFSSGLGGSERG